MIKPASATLLNNLNKLVLQEPINGLQTSLVIFPNAGDTTLLRYLVEEPNDVLKIGDQDTIYFVHVPSGFNYFLVKLKKDLLSLSQIPDLTPKSYETNDVLELFKHFVQKDTKHKFVFIFNKFQLLFEPENAHLLDFFYGIKSLNKNCSYVFVVSSEVDESDIKSFKGFAGFFVRKLVWGKELIFDNESASSMIEAESLKKDIKLPESTTQKLMSLCYADPTVLKISLLSLFSSPVVLKNFEAEFDPTKLYHIIGDTSLTLRYERILAALKPASLQCLLNNYAAPTDYLINTGLVVSSGVEGKFAAHNKLFDAFVQKHRDLITTYLTEKSAAAPEGALAGSSNLDRMKKAFTGQETLLFKVFSASPDKIVSREDVAQTLWGDTWEQKYSDWAIDKIMSTMRGKLEKYQFAKTIKTFKGQGFMLA